MRQVLHSHMRWCSPLRRESIQKNIRTWWVAGLPNALVQLRAHYHHCGVAASKSARQLQRSLGADALTPSSRRDLWAASSCRQSTSK